MSLTSDELKKIQKDIQFFGGSLVSVGGSHQLEKSAAQQWQQMVDAARKDGVELVALSGYRSVQKQYEIIVDKKQQGRKLQEILTKNTKPGLSEHHTGRALDIGEKGQEGQNFKEQFENTAAF